MRKLDQREKRYAIREEVIKKKFAVDEKGNLEEVTWTPMIRVLYIMHLLAQIGEYLNLRDSAKKRAKCRGMLFKLNSGLILLSLILLFLGIEITFLYLNMILQTNQTGVAGWEGFRVPERYNCITSQHVRFFNLSSFVCSN